MVGDATIAAVVTGVFGFLAVYLKLRGVGRRNEVQHEDVAHHVLKLHEKVDVIDRKVDRVEESVHNLNHRLYRLEREPHV